ncbi:uncharacterized protein EAF01_001024 [Botrytis porri]|uniref:uncharacterized protein n=1 Tax=Botrytis porri TaxID=87229 RepID=UPI001900ACB6|nr:uncharacterized protein EAF01_001024 [Botrytis porri]KAF7914618.1 hypothetical protein EAF01_001024 [Botrytis porri]
MGEIKPSSYIPYGNPSGTYKSYFLARLHMENEQPAKLDSESSRKARIQLEADEEKRRCNEGAVDVSG